MAVYSKIDLYLYVDGVGTFEVVQFSADWAKNHIPAAICVLATGREATSGTEAAAIHSKLDAVQKLARAAVYFHGYGDWDEGIAWPDEDVKIFEGRILGYGYQKVNGKVSFVAHISHWCIDLDFSSAISTQSHPTNPAEYSFAAGVNSVISTGLFEAAATAGLALSAEGRSITELTLRQDMWAAAIKPMLVALAENKHVLLNGVARACVGFEDGKNDMALQALARFEGPSPTHGLPYSSYSVPLSLSLGEMVPASVLTAIADTIRFEPMRAFASTTLWAKLVSCYAQAFWFSVIPLVERALVVPFVPGLRQTYCKEISADDYDHIDLNGAIARPIRAVAVVGGREMDTGITDAHSGTYVGGIGGCFKPEAADEAGLLHFINPPIWLANVASSGFSPMRTSGRSGRRPISTATTPVDVSADIKGAVDGRSRETILLETGDMFNAYAQAFYLYQMLRGRSGSISGKLRFDIAPGSTIRVETTPERVLGSSDLLGGTIIGDVTRVSIMISADPPQGATALQLTNHRTEAENDNPKFSTAAHPLFSTVFKGAPLVDALFFPGEGC